MTPPTKPTPVSLDQPLPNFDISIALRNGKRSITTHPISHFVSYDHLHPSFRNFALFIFSKSISNNYKEVLHISH